MTKHYGYIEYTIGKKVWVITSAEPHVLIKLKNIFPKINVSQTRDFEFADTEENAADLFWFMNRYPLKISQKDEKYLKKRNDCYFKNINDLERLLLPDYHPPVVELINGKHTREYQEKAYLLHMRVKKYLLGDDLGLGKTVSAIISFRNPGTLPALVVCQTHLQTHWAKEQIPKFTNLQTHIIKKGENYSLPKADVYVITYGKIAKWVDQLSKGFIKSVIFDEIQELRIPGSQKYSASKRVVESTVYSLGLSATPIYNYGTEIYHVMNLLNPGCLGPLHEFIREWTHSNYPKYTVRDPKALGSYLRDKFLLLRRTRADVSMELPPINTVVHTVNYDGVEVAKQEKILHDLAVRVNTGSFMERGEAARELDARARHLCGVSKARYVAEFVKILLDDGEPVLLAGWHRDVYEIWETEFEKYNPVFYTGSEYATQKNKSKEDFINGKTNLLIMSLRSGIGVDGLQNRCSTIVYGELDWSPGVHNQIAGRIHRDRDDGKKNQVMAFYLVSDFGTDPVMVEVLGIKSSQAENIMNPLQATASERYSDDSRIKLLAKRLLESKQNEG